MPGPSSSSFNQRDSSLKTRRLRLSNRHVTPTSAPPTHHSNTKTAATDGQATGRLTSLDASSTVQAPFAMAGGFRLPTQTPSSTDSPSKSPQTGVASDNESESPSGTSHEPSTSQGLLTAQSAYSPTASQKQLNDYREKLARDLERRELSARGGLVLNSAEKTRVSPIQEETIATPPQLTSTTDTTTSTESGNTVRGGMTPAGIASTPSYPFPRMAPAAFNYPRPFAPHSPGASFRPSHIPPFNPSSGVQDSVLSNNSTPASNCTFNPPGASPHPEGFDFPNPNLYDLSLMLSSEPGLDAWWNTVVQIMKDVYKAERVTLAVPADSTDIENVPWGQKATYNEHQEDELSLGYLARGSSVMQISDYDITSDAFMSPQDSAKPITPMRPGLSSRHSFTSYEESKEKSCEKGPAQTRPGPTHLTRSRSYYPTAQTSRERPDKSQLNKTTLQAHDLLEEQQEMPIWEAPYVLPNNNRGRVLPVLQALDYEADPLIDHSGVIRVLERGKAVALTRTYPYLEKNQTCDPSSAQKPSAAAMSSDKSKGPNKPMQRSESAPKLTSLFGGSRRGKAMPSDKGKSASIRLEEDAPRPTTPKYEEYEQAPPSPWSQSPAPSPAVRADPKENPFFTDAMVDEESFNPGTAPFDYMGLRPPEAIGVDNSWTVLHIPLIHVLLSKTTRPFKLNVAAMDQLVHSRSVKDDSERGSRGEDRPSPESPSKNKPAPIAILSILSPIIPYPSNLRHSLEHLAPHMATSFSISRHYSNLETELAGLQRRRPSTTGFGAVAPDGRPLATPAYIPGGELSRQQSIPGSMTSPSDYSGVSKSMTASPAGTPGWESGSLSNITDRRQGAVSPAATSHGGESYFSSKQRSASVRQEANRTAPKDISPVERRHSRFSITKQDMLDAGESVEKEIADAEDLAATGSKNLPSRAANQTSTTSSVEHNAERPKEYAPENLRLEHVNSHQPHTMLHSYGADFASTFQSLPPSSSLLSRPPPTVAMQTRGMSFMSAAVDMPPPSDKLKGLMLDALPAHVFVALPQTGEVVWVNSRYLSYRGQTVTDLAEDPWSSIHPDDCDDYLKAWGHSLRTGEQFSRTVRIKRFDGAYRWFYARAVASKDKRGVIMQFLGSYMDIHDQHIAELKAARQEEIEASEAKHRLLANLIPQIIFTATEEDGITFANEQWLSYTGQSFDDSLGLGFLDFVHPEDLAQCRIPIDEPQTPLSFKTQREKRDYEGSESSVASSAGTARPHKSPSVLDTNLLHKALSRNNSSENSSAYGIPPADLTELARKGIIKVATDSNGRLSYTTEVRLRSKAGEYRWHLIRCVEIDTIDFGSGASSYFGSATDINDHKLLEAKLKEAMESKSRFLSNMSHEIRTPLIGISGMVSFLQDTILNEEQRDYTNTIQTSANSLIMIINDILDLSKVDAGMMKLKFEWFHTRSLIEDVNELVSTMAIAKGLELNYLVEADVPAWVKGDKVRIRQVLLNVIGNAIKFTTVGEVFSRCRVFTDASENGENEIMLEYAIIDTGQGFTKQEADLIFKPFSQIDGSSTRQHGGSGLGLVISKQLVELHGGKMVGTAVPGKGSTFIFTAQFALPTPEDHPDLPVSFASTVYSESPRHPSHETATSKFQPLPAPKQPRLTGETSPGSGDQGLASPGLGSNGSSNPSIHSGRSHITDRSSVTSVNTGLSGLARFSEAAKASGQDLSQMKLEMPSGRSSPGRTVTPGTDRPGSQLSGEFRPPMYSILIICPQFYSREATTQHIEMTLPKDVPHQITAIATVEEAQELIGGDDPIKFTHIVINLGSPEAVVSLMHRIIKSQKAEKTIILVLSDSVQRQVVLKLAGNKPYEQLLTQNSVTFIYKPVKPSRFAVIFDPDKMRDLSIDRNRSTAQRMVENQKASYQEIEKRMGNKGYRVLLVEDNPVNQKVLMKYLKKIGVAVDMAVDGVECIEMVLSRPHKHYSLILVITPCYS